jgi:xanthine dehydrogenase YagR molybdenum-binding subunit
MPLLLQDDRINYGGQPIAAVIAETLTGARRAAGLVDARCESRPSVTVLRREAPDLFAPAAVLGEPADSMRGDLARAWADAEVRLDAIYTAPMQNHHPIEPHVALASWAGDRLTLYASLQGVQGCRDVLARSFGLPAESVRVFARFLGGGFGSKGRSWWPCVMIAVMAARHVGRPVRLELSRDEMSRMVGGRAASIHRVALGARADGHLTALEHHAVAQSSAVDEFCDPHGRIAQMLYACPSVATSHRLARIHAPHPTPMRPPGHGPGSFALESAMDELATALAIDPLELRLRNHADRDPHSGLPWSSKSLRECYAVGAERFGWRGRRPEPRSMRDGHWLIGWGMASATYPVHRQRAAARAVLLPDGTVVVQSATHDLGTGTYTVMSQVAAEMLGLPVDHVRFEMGDSDLPESPRAAGSMTAASVAPAVAAAARALRDRIIAAACADDRSPLGGLDPAGVEIIDGMIMSRRDPARAERCADVAARRPAGSIEAVGEVDPAAAAVSMHAFGANFAEVAVDADLGEVRVRRFVACYGAGRILNAKMARSQQIGGIVFGIGMALGEATRLDAASGRITNARLTDYLLPVHADVPEIDVSFVAEDDPHVNATGVKGIGMIGAVGVAAAIANAVFHATGVRVRDLPITPDKLL